MRRVALGVAAVIVHFSGVLAAAPVATPEWRSGFETGFPGEWLNYDGGSYTASGTPNAGKNEAWTIVDSSDPLVPHGSHAYKGWAFAPQADSHRAYPAIHSDIPTPLVNSFLVYLDVDYGKLSTSEWVHFATWGNNPDWAVHTMSVRARKLEMAHLSWSYIGPTPQPDFPLKQWVRFTAYIRYQGAQGTIRVWQDGVAVLEGTYTNVSGTNLMRAHWGWYSSGSIDQGVQYNDEIQIWRLSEPLTDLVTEPASPYTPDPPPGGTGGTGGAGGAGGASGAAGAANGGSAALAGAGGGSAATGGGWSSSGGGSSGGTGSSGSAGFSAGAGGTANAADSADDGGCGCRTPPRGEKSSIAWLALGALALRRARRRPA
jgi:MYXO-CTERM domain-containing protein